jgi:predicted DsbA family dithiol-disulfide isomerase
MVSLAESKGISLAEAQQMSQYVTEMAAREGLQFNFAASKTANTLNAHRFLHLAKSHEKQSEAKERLMRAYFVEGKFIDKPQIFEKLATELGIEKAELDQFFSDSLYLKEVQQDIQAAQAAGVRGVPHFRINGTQNISGAQGKAAFSKALREAYKRL